MIDSIVGAYRIEEQIARGGSALIYRARHLQRGSTVALKMIPSKADGYTSLRAQLFNEAALTANLNHRGIVKTLEKGEIKKGAYLIQEFIPGQPLHRLLREQTRPGKGFSLSRALDIAADLAEALAHLHGHNIVHADLKPPNILCGENRIAICDLGLAVKAGALRPPGLLMGTPYYMAPEMADGRMIDERTDIWSLGVILFEMLTGARPFGLRTNDPSQILRSVREAPLPRLLEDQPPPVRILTEFLLEKNKMQRPRNAGKLALQLRGLRATCGADS